MTDDEAKTTLAALAKHYREPVLPLSRFCVAIETWFQAIERANTEPTLLVGAAFWARRQGAAYHAHLRDISRDIRKSNLLGRLLYDGEALRTVPCPKHAGHWDGQAMILGNCPHACDGTGWLREEKA